MSTVKTDAITAVSTNGDLSLDGLGTGGVSIASTLKMTKGGDIASASPLVIDTDGNYFDVTGTTNFSAMTVESGNFFMLQFDGALTITHGSGIELPGAANLTTATGDRLMCYATAADTVEVMSVETEAAASAGGFTLGTEQATTSGTLITFGSIPAGTTMIVIMFEVASLNASSGVHVDVTIGDAGGLETAGYTSSSNNIIGGTALGDTQTDAFTINVDDGDDYLSGTMTLCLEDAANFSWVSSHCMSMRTGTPSSVVGGGSKSLTAELTQVAIGATTAWQTGAINIMYQ